MSELLFDVDLRSLPDDYLRGEWCVAHRVLNRTDPDSPLAVATRFVLQSNTLELQASEIKETGQWSIQRDALLNRPYLDLNLSREQSRALITRLRRSSDGQHGQLNLYFQSGMELQLSRPPC
ncbi:hypothetical protein LJY25_02670 [Hymenobacter sp. BT175]|uniref:hypothetical protein n=1 Tax=Hymenobacter translucens TaxID=2886507 RepID=UPI001D0EDF75|nr:hypothetical protein [Hymenobacter translucens]MCC2545334.1 hypothetical protein [Hymenobacter translucens]